MNDNPKYIPFPLYLVSGLPENLNQIFNYGIYNFSKSISYPDLSAVYSQIIYEYYRGQLPTVLLTTIERLIKQDLFVPDEDYNGFSSDGSEFNPQEGI